MIANLLPIPGLRETSEAFKERLVEIASELGLDASALAAVMKLESGFDPKARNPSGGATGLIQFMPKTAELLGTTTDALAMMSAVEQLEYVKKFYEPFRGRIVDEGDHYIATFMPAFLGKPRNSTIAEKGSPVYDQNAGLDVTDDGILTVDDVKRKLERVTQTALASLRKGGKSIVVEVPKGSEPAKPSRGPLFSEPAGSSSARHPEGSAPSGAASRAQCSAAAEAALRRRVSRYFRDHPEGISPAQVRAWIATVRRGGGFTREEADHVFRCMLAEGEIAVANGLFYSRLKTHEPAELAETKAPPPRDRRQEEFWS